MKRLYLALAILAALILPLGIALSTCSAPAPNSIEFRGIKPVEIDTFKPKAAAQATATASQTVKVTLTRKPTAQDASQATKQGGAGGLSLNGTDGGSTAPTDGESITIEVSQAVGVAAGASASAFVGNDGGNVRNEHARLGVVAFTAPGILAADYQLARIDVPPWLLGTPLELGLGVAGNLEVGALGLTAGGKAFAGVWGWSRWDLGEQGVAAGVGLRF